MKILIAPDKFKHSLSSFEVCSAISKGLLDASNDFSLTVLPLADGGDGLSEIIPHYLSAHKKTVNVLDPLLRNLESSFLVSADGKTAFIEMAKASGLQLLKRDEHNPLITSTFGTGQLIIEAINQGIKNIILGIGGSATNDGGIGMASALGFRFMNNEEELDPLAKNLKYIQTIDRSAAIDLDEISIQVACDVTNPLTGTNGATFVYGPQKGADAEMILTLEEGMINYAEVLQREFGQDMNIINGTGAAGGLGAGCIAFLNAKLVSGIDLILEYANADELIASADVVITGEGKIDHQSLNGKVLSGISMLCSKHKKPLIAFCGILELSPEQLKTAGIDTAFAILDRPIPIEDAFTNAASLLSDRAFEAGKLIKASLDTSS